MPAYYLEALTVTLGLILLMAEAFVPAKNKAWVGILSAIGLTAILGLTFIAISPGDKPDAAWAKWPLWNFYRFDSLARFYKVFALVTTIFVVLLSVDYRKILARFTDHPAYRNRLRAQQISKRTRQRHVDQVPVTGTRELGEMVNQRGHGAPGSECVHAVRTASAV